MRRFIIALAAALAQTVAFVREGTRWVWRTVTGTHPLPVEVSAVEEAAEAVLATHQAHADVGPAGDWHDRTKWPFAVAAKEFLWGGDDIYARPRIDHLPANIQAWLLALDEDQVETALAIHLSDLEAHLSGTQPSRHLPALLSTADLIAQAEAAATERQAVHDALQEILDDPNIYSRAA